MEMTALAAWSALALAVTLSPGPDTLLVAGHAARRGVRAGLAAVAGIVAGGLWYMALCGFGYLSLVSASPTLFGLARIAGAAYLLLIGAQMIWRAFRPAAPSPSKAPAAEDLAAPFRQGLLTNVLNPKVAVFYLAALPQFIGAGEGAAASGALLIAIHYAMGALWLSLVALGAARAGSGLKRTPAMRWLEGAIGAFFVGLAGKLAIERP